MPRYDLGLPRREIALYDIEVGATHAAASNADEDSPGIGWGRGSSASSRGWVSIGPWLDDLPRAHRAAAVLVSGLRLGPLIPVG